MHRAHAAYVTFCASDFLQQHYVEYIESPTEQDPTLTVEQIYVHLQMIGKSCTPQASSY